MRNDFMRMRRFCKLIYFETLVNAWSFWLALEQILLTCSLKVRSLSILIPNNTSSLFAFIADPIIFIGLSTNGLSKNWNFPGLVLKILLWNHSQMLDISGSSFYIISSKLFPKLIRGGITCITSKFYCVKFHK